MKVYSWITYICPHYLFEAHIFNCTGCKRNSTANSNYTKNYYEMIKKLFKLSYNSLKKQIDLLVNNFSAEAMIHKSFMYTSQKWQWAFDEDIEYFNTNTAQEKIQNNNNE